MEAQRFPEDYDGIVAGAPANYWTHLLSEAAADMLALGGDPAAYIPSSKLPAIEAASLDACDALDGVKDGVIDNPMKCKFDPNALLCQGAESAACLTAPQVATLKKLYTGPVDAKGRPVFHGHAVGGATGPAGWSAWILGPSAGRTLSFAFGNNFFANMVFENSTWDYHTFNVDRDMKAADVKLAATLNSTDPNLERFDARGGKLILYHGWSDPAIPAANAIDYYQSVVSKMGAQKAAAFLRLFLVPGMQHCGGGPGPTSFDADAALDHWVESPTPPEQIIATKYKGNGPASGVDRTRPLCAYPAVARWKGTGSTSDAANFVCVGESSDAVRQ
jgi:feruloyl esterase